MMDDRDQSSTLLSGRVDDNAPPLPLCSHHCLMVVTPRGCVCWALNDERAHELKEQQTKSAHAIFYETMLSM